MSIGKRLALEEKCYTVRDCYEGPAPEAEANTSLFDSIALIVERGCVLVRQPDRCISGIVTTSALSLEFRQRAEPFLLVGEIENYIRCLIDSKFTEEQLKAVRDPNDDRNITSVADLTFGQFVRLLEDKSNWAYLQIPIDRAIFVQRLNKVRELRNDIMHFNPDPIQQEDLAVLRSFVNFIRDL